MLILLRWLALTLIAAPLAAEIPVYSPEAYGRAPSGQYYPIYYVPRSLNYNNYFSYPYNSYNYWYYSNSLNRYYYEPAPYVR